MPKDTWRVLLALLVLVAMVPLAGLGAAQDLTTRDTDLQIDQPDYIDGDVETTSVDGEEVYLVSGPSHDLRPTTPNGTVVDYGTETTGGELTYDAGMEQFTLSVNATGTYDLYWVYSEPVAVTRTVNGTNVTETETRQVRYEATVRVEDRVDVVHPSAGELEANEEAAANWRELNSTLQTFRGEDGLLFLPNDITTEQLVNKMVSTLVWTHDPIRGFDGTILATLLTIFLTLGGLLILGIRELIGAAVVATLYKKLNRHEAIEQVEGDVDEKLAAQAEAERQRAFAYLNHTDIAPNETQAAAYEQLGETPKAAWEALSSSILRPLNLIRWKLHAMSQHGYVARVDERAAADGGDGDGDADDTIVSATVVEADSVADDVDTVSLADPSPELADAVEWDKTVRTFDLGRADLDLSEENRPSEAPTLTMDELKERVPKELNEFGGTEPFGEAVKDLLQTVRDHELCNADGSIDVDEYILDSWLSVARESWDRYDQPVAKLQTEVLECAIRNYDRSDEAKRRMEAVEDGAR